MGGVRVVVLGRGGSGKSTFCRRLAATTGLPLVELDAHYWSAGLRPLPPEEWVRRQRALLSADHWIADGDLGPYDALSARLDRATHVVVLDPPLWLCCLRVLGRGRENLDFWRWTLTWRRHEWPRIQAALQTGPSRPTVLHLRSRGQVAQVLMPGGGLYA